MVKNERTCQNESDDQQGISGPGKDQRDNVGQERTKGTMCHHWRRINERANKEPTGDEEE